jgi:hypothetical protein
VDVRNPDRTAGDRLVVEFQVQMLLWVVHNLLITC